MDSTSAFTVCSNGTNAGRTLKNRTGSYIASLFENEEGGSLFMGDRSCQTVQQRLELCELWYC